MCTLSAQLLAMLGLCLSMPWTLLTIVLLTQSTWAGGRARLATSRNRDAVNHSGQKPFWVSPDDETSTSTKSIYPQPLSIVDGPVHVRDPTIVYNEQTKQYIVLSTGNELPYFSAPSLTGPYIQEGSVLGNSSIIGSSYNPWAPDISVINGKFYAYYCVSHFGTQYSTIGVATSSSGEPESFQDLGALFSTKKGNLSNALDPSLVPGGKYLSYGSYFDGLYLAKLINLTSVEKDSLPGIKIAGGFSSPNAIEGSFIYEKGPWYYLFLSSGQCCGFNRHQLPEDNTTEYKVLVGRSREVTGPYYDRNGVSMLQGGGSTVLSSSGHMYAPGGQSVYRDPNSGRDVMVFHYSIREDPNLIARLGIYYLDFSDHGWPAVVSV